MKKKVNMDIEDDKDQYTDHLFKQEMDKYA